MMMMSIGHSVGDLSRQNARTCNNETSLTFTESLTFIKHKNDVNLKW